MAGFSYQCCLEIGERIYKEVVKGGKALNDFCKENKLSYAMASLMLGRYCKENEITPGKIKVE